MKGCAPLKWCNRAQELEATMANLTISVNNEVLKRARVRALEELAEQCRCGREGKIWNRDELHER